MDDVVIFSTCLLTEDKYYWLSLKLNQMVLLEAVRIWFGDETKDDVNKVEVNIFLLKSRA